MATRTPEPPGLGAAMTMTDLMRDPYPEFARRREASPVLREGSWGEDAPSMFGVYRHDDVAQILRDGVTYSSRLVAEGMAEVWGRKIIVGMDAPEHQRHRALVSGAFRAKALARWEDVLVRRVVDELLDALEGGHSADLVKEFTFPFPAKVIAGVLGLPEDDYLQFQSWAIGIIGIANDWDLAHKCAQELRDYLETIVEARRIDPRDDLVSDLVMAELDGEALDDEEIYSFLRMLLPAGIETTYRSSGNLLHLLLTHPAQLEAVRADRSLIPQAIEEGLRFESPVLAAFRIANVDTTVAGVDIPEGSILMLMLASANRDPAVFDRPEEFDIFREPKQHLSFGAGPHLCLGLHLARMETRIALDLLLDRLPGLRLDEVAARAADAHIGGDLTFRSPTQLPVVWD